MDAAEDRDIKFQRASADLIKDLSENLPSLLWKSRVHNGQNIQVARRWAQAAKTERLISLVRTIRLSLNKKRLYMALSMAFTLVNSM